MNVFVDLLCQLIREVPQFWGLTALQRVTAGCSGPGDLLRYLVTSPRSTKMEHISPNNFGLQNSFSISSQHKDTPEPEEFSPHCVGMGEELVCHHVVHFLVWCGGEFVLIRVVTRALL